MLESNQEQLDTDLLLNVESDSELLNSPKQVYPVTVSKFSTPADFPTEIQGCKTNSLSDTGTQVSCISYDFYRNVLFKTKINTNCKVEVSSADG